MRLARTLDTTRHAIRATRAWLFWLALALAAAHSLASWHVYTHDAELLSQKANQEAGPCGLCIAVAGIGGAVPQPPALAVQAFAQEAPAVALPLEHPQLAAWQPYAIRAPPVLSA